MTATDVKYLANCTLETLEKIRNDRDFDLLWNDLNEKADSLDLREPKQPKKGKCHKSYWKMMLQEQHMMK